VNSSLSKNLSTRPVSAGVFKKLIPLPLRSLSASASASRLHSISTASNLSPITSPTTDDVPPTGSGGEDDVNERVKEDDLVSNLALLLILVRKLHKHGAITDQQRGRLKDIILECDPFLLSKFQHAIQRHDQELLIEELLLCASL